MPKFIDELRYNDPKLHEAVSAVAGLAMSPGVLDGKTKLLITIALDAFMGSKKGVKHLTKQAKKSGITKEEIAEALRLAYFVAGNGVLSVSGKAFEEFEDDEEDDDDNDDDDGDKDEKDDEGIQEQPVDTATLMVFDEELIDGPSYLKEKILKNDEKASEEDEYEIKEFPTY